MRLKELKEEVGSVRNKEWFPFGFPLILVILIILGNFGFDVFFQNALTFFLVNIFSQIQK